MHDVEFDTEEIDATDKNSEVLLCLPKREQRTWGGRLKVTGVRWAESARRKKGHGVVTIPDKKAKRFFDEEMPEVSYKLTPQGGVALGMDNRENAKMVEMCYKTHTTTLNPIVDWDNGEVWEFLKEYEIPYCELYDQGFKRLGCIGCPMGSKEQREKEFERYPKYKALYLKAFEKMIENRGGMRKYHTAEELYRAWLEEKSTDGKQQRIL